MKKVVTFSIFLCALCLFSPNGECSINLPNEFNHNLKPIPQNQIGNFNANFNKPQNPVNMPFISQYPKNNFSNRIVNKPYKNPFWNNNRNIYKIGNHKVFYKNNLPYKIGEKRVIYGPNHRIKSIGNQPVFYRNGKIHKIGDLPVIYDNNNEIIRIGNWSVSYNA